MQDVYAARRLELSHRSRIDRKDKDASDVGIEQKYTVRNGGPIRTTTHVLWRVPGSSVQLGVLVLSGTRNASSWKVRYANADANYG